MIKLIVIFAFLYCVFGRPNEYYLEKFADTQTVNKEHEDPMLGQAQQIEAKSEGSSLLSAIENWLPSLKLESIGSMDGDNISNGVSIQSYSKLAAVKNHFQIFTDYTYSDKNETEIVGAGFEFPYDHLKLYYNEDLNSLNHSFYWHVHV